jgi:hypothetical protein
LGAKFIFGGEKVTMKKLLSVFLALALALSFAGFALAAEDEDGIIVTLRIEGISECLYDDLILITSEDADDLTVLELVQALEEEEDVPEFVFDEAGTYITAIGGEAAGTGAEWAGWQVLVNGVAAPVGIDAQTVKDGDVVVFYYSDEFGIGIQFPVLDDSHIAEGYVLFTSIDTTYDPETWEPTVTTKPVAGADVVWDGKDYVTDADGKITLGDAAHAGWNTVAISRYDEATGLPTVLRYAPGWMNYSQFSDTAAGAWYQDAIEIATLFEYFKGVSTFAFSPDTNVTQAQLLQILARFVGADAEGTGADWYAPALAWATEDVLTKAEAQAFEPNTAVTRAEVFGLFYRMIVLLEEGADDSAGTTWAYADITGVTDYAVIAEADRDAISWAVAAGLIKGTSGDTLTIEPNRTITRAEFCQLLFNYYYGA